MVKNSVEAMEMSREGHSTRTRELSAYYRTPAEALPEEDLVFATEEALVVGGSSKAAIWSIHEVAYWWHFCLLAPLRG